MEKLDDILRSYTVSPDELTVKNKLLGAGFVVVDKNGILYEGASGRLAFAPDSAPFTTHSLIWLASMTKLPTAVAALQLVDRGLLTIDQDLRSLEPELAAMEILRGFDDQGDGKPILEPNTRPITLHHLLTHTLGLAMDLPVPDLMRWSRYVGRTAVNLDWNRAGMTTPLSFAPGEGWMYGMAYDWAGSVLETLTKKTLGEWMQSHIFAPLGMERTGFWPERILGNRNSSDEKGGGEEEDRLLEFAFSAEDGITGAQPYPDAELRPGTSILRTEHEMESGGAGLFSTPHDYGLFLSGLLRSSSSSSSHHQEQEPLLKPQTLKQLFTPQLTPPQRAQLTSTVSAFHTGFAPEMPLDGSVQLDHGLGGVINLDDLPGKRRAGSMTWSGMSNGRWWVDPATGIAAAMFTMVLPHGNDVVNRMWDELERAVYGDLLPGLKGKEHVT
ncbi:beta-lactamase [Apiospora rasikravindrae]|uniref:Beta-lactamase n=1 Tax=Apiospora rasikravindrae TaxID=990691 RepID=A0ABR1SDE0_9PEZI